MICIQIKGDFQNLACAQSLSLPHAVSGAPHRAPRALVSSRRYGDQLQCFHRGRPIINSGSININSFVFMAPAASLQGLLSSTFSFGTGWRPYSSNKTEILKDPGGQLRGFKLSPPAVLEGILAFSAFSTLWLLGTSRLASLNFSENFNNRELSK